MSLDAPKISKYVQHPYPAWHDRVNFIVHVAGPYGDPLESGEDYIVREQVGCHKLSPTELELCALPYFVYGYRLGDILEIDPVTYEVKRIKQKSGRYLYRIIFSCSNDETIRIADQCKQDFGALFEWYNAKHCAVDIATYDLATGFCGFMKTLQAQKVLEFEDGGSVVEL